MVDIVKKEKLYSEFRYKIKMLVKAAVHLFVNYIKGSVYQGYFQIRMMRMALKEERY